MKIANKKTEINRQIPVNAYEVGDSWDYFGLSYASWLVLPRIALQSMPEDWQKKFFSMVEEMQETLEFPKEWDECSFVVTAKKGRKFVKHFFPHYRHNELPRKNSSPSKKGDTEK